MFAVAIMRFHALTVLTLWCLLSFSASAKNSPCASFLLKNITDEIQSSIVLNLLNNTQSILEDAKKYTTVKTSASSKDTQCSSFLLKNITDEIQSSIVVTLLNNAQIILEDVKKYSMMKTSCFAVETVSDRPMDCAEIKEKNASAHSGIYKIWPLNRVVNGPVEVYCDMDDDGGAWTVLQRRGDFGSGRDYFFRDWQSYKNGFGDLSKDFWFGNDNIFALTNLKSNVVKFTLTDWEGNQTFATYDEFWIADEFNKYTMHVSGYRGTAGDSFSYHDGCPFSTKDKRNDMHKDKNCAVAYKGAWWYKKCYESNLNGIYLRGKHKSYDGVVWHGKGEDYSLKDTVIKIRPKDFLKKLDNVTPL